MALTSNQKIRLEAQRQYWIKREEQQREANLLAEKSTEAEIERIYSDMYVWADNQINAFFGKYADAEGITLAEAKRRVNKADIEKYEKLAKQYVKDKDFSDKANAEMRLYNATMKINRLELLKAEIGLGQCDGFNRLDALTEKTLTDRAVAEYYRQAGILGQQMTEADVLKSAKNIVNADFYNATFSDRIWAHADNLKDELAQQLNSGFIAGIGSRGMAQRIKEKFDVSLSDAQRLVVTELRRVQTEVARDSYEQNGFDQYEYVAVNRNACPICREIDGDIFYVRDMEAGLNAPPLHPRCHCTTAPYVDEAEHEAWLRYLESGGTSAEWDAMPDAERQSLIDRVRFSAPAEPIQESAELPAEAVTRTDAESMLLDDVGFVAITDHFDMIPDDLVIDIANQLNKLEQAFGVVHKSKTCFLSGYGLSDDTCAQVTSRLNDPLHQHLTLNVKYYKSTERILAETIRDVETNQFMPISPKYYSVATVTHEYGHMLENSILSERLDPFDTFQTRATTLEGKYKAYQKYRYKESNGIALEVQAIAKEKNPDIICKDLISDYGKTNSREWFAEVFANSQCGEPNELGLAMSEWLRRQGYSG